MLKNGTKDTFDMALIMTARYLRVQIISSEEVDTQAVCFNVTVTGCFGPGEFCTFNTDCEWWPHVAVRNAYKSSPIIELYKHDTARTLNGHSR